MEKHPSLSRLFFPVGLSGGPPVEGPAGIHPPIVSIALGELAY